jgi:hypothetical protein
MLVVAWLTLSVGFGSGGLEVNLIHLTVTVFFVGQCCEASGLVRRIKQSLEARRASSDHPALARLAAWLWQWAIQFSDEDGSDTVYGVHSRTHGAIKT